VRLNEKRIARVADRVVDFLLEEDLIDFKPTTKQMVSEVGRFNTEDLAIEDEITNEAMERLATYSRKIVEGTTEWMILLAKHKDEIAAKRGYVL
jgi:uncharacterized protein